MFVKLGVVGAVLLACSTAGALEPISLSVLERALDGASALRLANASTAVAESQQQVALTQLSPRLFGSGALSASRDASRPQSYHVEQWNSDGLRRDFDEVLTPQPTDYTHLEGVIGVRVALFGSRAALWQRFEGARANVQQQRLRQQVTRLEALKALRYAYVQAYHRWGQGRLAKVFLSGELQTNDAVLRREAAQLMLRADRLAVESMFLSARQQAAQTQATTAQALAQVKALSGYPLNAGQLQAPEFSVDCLSQNALLDAMPSHPEIELHVAMLAQQQQQLSSASDTWNEAGLSLSHRRVKESNGSTGHNTSLAFDFSMPLFAKQWQQAQTQAAQTQVDQAQLLLDARRQDYQDGLRHAFNELQAQRENVRLMQQRLDAATEMYRVLRLRAHQVEGERIDQLLQARFALYAAANARLESGLVLAKAQIDLLGYAQQCSTTTPVHAEVNADWATDIAPLLAQPVLLAHTPTEPLKTSLQSNQALSWYAWHTLQRFEAMPTAQFWAAVPPGSQRILLSLSAQEVQAVGHNSEKAATLRHFLDSAAQRQIKVALLLGDPHWALASGRPELLRLVRALNGFAFDGIHLDIERSQLPAAQQLVWDTGLIDTVKQLRQITAWSISLSLHPRDAAKRQWLKHLQQAGATEVVLMTYITNVQRVAAILAPLMQRHPTLRFGVAQSIEPELSSTESYAHMTQRASAQAWQQLAQQLQKESNFSGIVIQSLDHYLDSLAHENQL